MRLTMSKLIGAGLVAAGLLGTAGAASAATAVFAGGCFWSVEKNFDAVRGVTGTVSGFSGGSAQNPTYRQVIAGGTGHVEAVQVTYDPSVVSYAQLLDAYWRSIDPTDPRGQFCDKGAQYETVVFVGSAAERAAAESSKAQVASELGARVSTRIEGAQTFWPAEAEHQNFHVTNPAHYQRYAIGCGRAQSLARVWGNRAFVG